MPLDNKNRERLQVFLAEQSIRFGFDLTRAIINRLFQNAGKKEKGNVKKLYKEANSLYNNHQYEQAIDACKDIIVLDVRNSNAYLLLGKCGMQLQKNDLALQAFNKAIRYNTEWALAYLFKAVLFEQLERFDEAIEHIDLAIRLDGNQRLGLSKEQHHPLIVSKTNELTLDMDTYKVCLIAKQHGYDAALKELEKEKYLTNEHSLNIKGTFLYELGSYQEALAAFEQAALVNPREISYRESKKKCLTAINMIDNP